VEVLSASVMVLPVVVSVVVVVVVVPVVMMVFMVPVEVVLEPVMVVVVLVPVVDPGEEVVLRPPELGRCELAPGTFRGGMGID
jgi:hypothetical protein